MNNLKKVFITGAGSGLGKQAAIELARRNHTVYATVQYETELNDLITISQKENLKLQAFKLDILNESERALILNYDIDVFISNSAIGDSGSVADIDIDRIKNVFETNVFCNIQIIQLAISNMIKKHSNGRIVILSSLVGRIPMPFLSPYCSSKFALEGFGICLKQEMKLLKKLSGKTIEVCLIEPGAYATGFNKENIEKKYTWMNNYSYFSEYEDWLKNIEKNIWNFLEQKPFDTIIKKYIKSVESNHIKFRYTAPWWQSLFVQIGRIFGM